MLLKLIINLINSHKIKNSHIKNCTSNVVLMQPRQVIPVPFCPSHKLRSHPYAFFSIAYQTYHFGTKIQLIAENCEEENPKELLKKANEQLCALVLAIMNDKYYHSGEGINIDELYVKDFDVDNKFLFARENNHPKEREDRLALFAYANRLLCKTLSEQESGRSWSLDLGWYRLHHRVLVALHLLEIVVFSQSVR
jgi:hypothetical protein